MGPWRHPGREQPALPGPWAGRALEATVGDWGLMGTETTILSYLSPLKSTLLLQDLRGQSCTLRAAGSQDRLVAEVSRWADIRSRVRG